MGTTVNLRRKGQRATTKRVWGERQSKGKRCCDNGKRKGVHPPRASWRAASAHQITASWRAMLDAAQWIAAPIRAHHPCMPRLLKVGLSGPSWLMYAVDPSPKGDRCALRSPAASCLSFDAASPICPSLAAPLNRPHKGTSTSSTYLVLKL